MQAGAAAEADGSGLACETRTGHTRQKLLACQSRGLHWTHADMVKEERSLRHTYVCSEERTVVHHAVLTQMEVRA